MHSGYRFFEFYRVTIISLCFLCLGALSFQDVASADTITSHDEKAIRIVQAVYDRPDGTTWFQNAIMTLKSEDNVDRVRQFYVFRKNYKAGESSTLIRFVSPYDIEDTGLLTKDGDDGSSDQWLYLPSLGRERRIASDRKGGRFVGSEIYYEDMQDRKPDKDLHRYVGQETINNYLCDIIESVPIDPENSSYSKRVSWVHPKTLIPIRVDFYQNGNQSPLKRLLVNKIDNIQGYWTIMDFSVVDLEKGYKTNIKNLNVVYDRELPDSIFSQNTLQNPSADKKFRDIR